MSNQDSPPLSAAGHSRGIWLLTLIVAALPAAFGLYQVWIYFDEAFPHIYWSRTLPAFAGVALGLSGIAAPLWVWMKRSTFRRWSGARQWGALGAVLLIMSLAYLTPFVLLVKKARHSHAVLQYTPSVYLHHYADHDHPNRLKFAVVGGPGTGHGGTMQDNDRVVITWNAWLEPRHLSRPPGSDPVVDLRCQAPLDTDSHPIEVRITTGRTVRFDTRGFINATVAQNGAPVVLPIEIAAGTHRFEIQTKQ